jgi:integrase
MMPKTKRRNAAKKCWSESFGYYGTTIRAAERNPGGVLYLLWLDKRGKQQKRSLQHRDRKLARKQALEMANAMASAVSPGTARFVTVERPQEKGPEPLTLPEGMARAFEPLKGLYPRPTKHAKQARKYADAAAQVLGPDTTWAELRPSSILYLVRQLARASRNGEGAVSAEKTCVILYAIASWLRSEELIPSTAAHSNTGWKLRVREEWRNTTGQRTRAVERPRHAVDEVAALFAALPQADPRLRLLVELAAELRAGQAVRARRTDLTLDMVGGFERGRFIVYGAGKKRGETVDLHPELRTLVDEVLSTGYLAEAEAAFQRGEVEDYFLFPAGKLKGGSVPLGRATAAHASYQAMRDLFEDLERIAGVEHRRGRSFYGLRRQATDLAPDFSQDARVLNSISGHADSATREQVYQDKENERVRARAAKTRRSMRQFLMNPSAAETDAIAA